MASSHQPLVTVVVCAYRIGIGIRATIDAILGQSYPSLKLIIIDDASGDDTLEVIQSYDDPRITVIENSTNLGIIGTRNRGLSEADTEFVAVCDHDDVWAHDKLEKQVLYMQNHPSCGLVGSYCTSYEGGKAIGVRPMPSTSSSFLKWHLLHKNCLLHSSLLMRREVLVENNISYCEGLQFADDWKLCLDFAKVGEIGIIPEALVSYFIHGQNWSLTAKDTMHESGAVLVHEELTQLLGAAVSREISEIFFYAVTAEKPENDLDNLKKVGRILERVASAFCEDKDVSTDEYQVIGKAMSQIWWRVVRASAGVGGPGRLKTYYDLETLAIKGVSGVVFFKEWLKALIKFSLYRLKA